MSQEMLDLDLWGQLRSDWMAIIAVLDELITRWDGNEIAVSLLVLDRSNLARAFGYDMPRRTRSQLRAVTRGNHPVRRTIRRIVVRRTWYYLEQVNELLEAVVEEDSALEHYLQKIREIRTDVRAMADLPSTSDLAKASTSLEVEQYSETSVDRRLFSVLRVIETQRKASRTTPDAIWSILLEELEAGQAIEDGALHLKVMDEANLWWSVAIACRSSAPEALHKFALSLLPFLIARAETSPLQAPSLEGVPREISPEILTHWRSRLFRLQNAASLVTAGHFRERLTQLIRTDWQDAVRCHTQGNLYHLALRMRTALHLCGQDWWSTAGQTIAKTLAIGAPSPTWKSKSSLTSRIEQFLKEEAKRRGKIWAVALAVVGLLISLITFLR